MMETTHDNAYLGQVLEQQARVDQELRPAKMQAPLRPVQSPPPGPRRDGGAAAVRAVDFRVTGFWLWKTVVVPPNVYVIHTRRGHAEPVTIGLGISFRFNPYRDAFLLIPAAMHLLGESAWWLPRWLDRLLPDVDVEGAKLERSHPVHDEPHVGPVEERPGAHAAR